MSAVNDLIEYLSNADGPIREPAEVGRRLAYCQQRCPEWIRSCSLHDRDEWIEILSTPGRECGRRAGVEK